MKLDKTFFARNTLDVAKDLLGKTLVVKIDGKVKRGIIVETEGYMGPDDLACHGRFGKTERSKVLFSGPGTVYVYLIYGMYYMLNFVTEKKDYPSAVLIRAIEPLNEKGSIKDLRKLGSGPGRLTRWLGITKSHNGLSINGDEIFVEDNGLNDFEIVETTRVGVEYAGYFAQKPWRFYIRDNEFVSRK
ncbi:hypothetical protein AUK11_04555 [bacterium CG2_30_37_16]|nr:MAG: hypothetical protein AUK11_04555 [bacterium CG2_30_37_16]PIP30758.1 MAG: 3-methyladenine DNA glycosylase [bacterium (Candidatus Howlettbacteria) CG23_combo_of_CG06-09_8_20_14_all_37_9]PJB05493.1 MAG: DNA-3-methyladenine glycosylase [bacterium (Candidatus Howlettbacteria) CG_4_9_14_3_um_filter_37_10]